MITGKLQSSFEFIILMSSPFLGAFLVTSFLSASSVQ